MDKKIITELKVPDFTKEFPANGKIYKAEELISFSRWNEYELIQVQLNNGMSLRDCFETYKTLWSAANDSRFGDVCVIVHNLMSSIKDLEKRIPFALQMAALFINEKDEDRGVITKEMIKTKIEDWDIEGYAINPFFNYAITFIPGFIPAYEENTNGISLKKKAE